MNEHAKSLLGSASVDPDKAETVNHVDAMPQAAQDGGLGTQAREGEVVAKIVRKGFSTGSLYYTDSGQNADLPDGTKLYTHPAAPSADKLRIAVEALSWSEKALERYVDALGLDQTDDAALHALYLCGDALTALSTPDALKGDAKWNG